MPSHTRRILLKALTLFALACGLLLSLVLSSALLMVLAYDVPVAEINVVRDPVGPVLFLLFEDTRYALGFDREQFWSIEVGDDLSEVRRKIGAPLFVTDNWREDGMDTWVYSGQANDHAACVFHAIAVDPSTERVVDVWSSWYVD